MLELKINDIPNSLFKDIDPVFIQKALKAFDCPESKNENIEFQKFYGSKLYKKQPFKSFKQFHKLEILYSLIFSVGGKFTTPSHPNEIFVMSGFIERIGRKPEASDNIKIICGDKYFHKEPNGTIFSQINFEIC